MLDFYLIQDVQANNTPFRHLIYVGGIEEEEFEQARDLKSIESHLDYYGKFRWSEEQIKMKLQALPPRNYSLLPNLVEIMKQAKEAKCGLAALGD